MTFHEGQIVVHPFHGPARIESIAGKSVRGSIEPYLNLRALDRDLRISVPVAGASEIGIRDVLSLAAVDELLAVLGAPSIPLEKQWSRRMKDLQMRLDTGRLDEIAVVTRELIRKGSLGTSMSESRMLRAARAQLVTELGVALSEERPEIVEELINATALGTVPAVPLDEVGRVAAGSVSL